MTGIYYITIDFWIDTQKRVDINHVSNTSDPMTTLILHTPSKKVQPSKQSFNQTLSTQTAVGFAMGKNLVQMAHQCDEVIILDKNTKAKVSAKMNSIAVSIHPPTRGNLIRYDIKFRNPHPIQYNNERLNKNGVGIRDGSAVVVPLKPNS